MAEFPEVKLLDNFQRTEENLSNGGKWKEFFYSKTKKGGTTPTGWQTGNIGIAGAYWAPEEWARPTGVHLQWNSINNKAGNSWVIFCCVSNPESEEFTGYSLELEEESTKGKFTARLERKDKAGITTLKTGVGELFEVGDFFGLSAGSTEVIYWRKKGAGAWEERLSSNDSTYKEGHVAFISESESGGPKIINFEAGGSKSSERFSPKLSLTGFLVPAGTGTNNTNMIL